MPVKSIVWKYFTKDSSTSARCNLCEKLIRTSGNTTNLRHHLKIHKEVDLELDENASNVSDRSRSPSVDIKVKGDTDNKKVGLFENVSLPVSNILLYDDDTYPDDDFIASTSFSSSLTKTKIKSSKIQNKIKKSNEEENKVISKPKTKEDIFGEFIASKLKLMTPEKQIIVEKEIIASVYKQIDDM